MAARPRGSNSLPGPDEVDGLPPLILRLCGANVILVLLVLVLVWVLLQHLR